MSPLRRRLLAAAALMPAVRQARAGLAYPQVTPRQLAFPRDFGAHLPYRTEWWYLTGQLDVQPSFAPGGASEGKPSEASNAAGAQVRLGIQLTFFRIRPPVDPDNPSRFAAHQLVLAHAAIADPRRGALLYEERIARTGFGVASVSEADTEVEVDRWRLAREAASGVYRGQVQGAQFHLELSATPTQPPLLQGDDGFSRKEPAGAGAAASLYYSQPQLALQARLALAGGAGAQRLGGRGWLDHEWSSTLMPPQAAGWDWVGFNLDDGSALTAFRIRRAGAADRDPPWFAYACLRSAARIVQTFAPAQVRFETLQTWASHRTRAVYPVAQRIQVGSRQFETRPLMPDQELDVRAASGFAYWEGASDLLEGGRAVGRGYLELTGYAGPVPGQVTG
ncbi:MAG TPA: lipocalin-like domain-containing protein [Burkholderiaceae bacterium]|nr:lipocalin-like domain-containing protein [Burkholderiaceae bacterium]